MKNIDTDLLGKAGKPLSPGEGFQGVTDRGGVFTPYPTIDAYHTVWQQARGIYGTQDQEREAKRTMRKAA